MCVSLSVSMYLSVFLSLSQCLSLSLCVCLCVCFSLSVWTTMARLLGKRLGWPVLHSGLLYRSLARWSIRTDIDDPVIVAIQARVIHYPPISVDLDSIDIMGRLSLIANDEGVRRAINKRIGRWGRLAVNGIVEGRDIGSLVFPSSPCKFMLVADIDDRVARRSEDSLGLTVETIRADIVRRDNEDTSREYGGMRAGIGAHTLDTSRLSIDGSLAIMMGIINKTK